MKEGQRDAGPGHQDWQVCVRCASAKSLDRFGCDVSSIPPPRQPFFFFFLGKDWKSVPHLEMEERLPNATDYGLHPCASKSSRDLLRP